MTTGKRLDLSGALEDTPQTRRCLASIDRDADALRHYLYGIQDVAKVLVDAQTRICEATEGLAQQLSNYKDQEFAEKEGSIAESMATLADNVNELKGWQDMLAAQMNQAVLKPVSDFLADDLSELEAQKDLYETASLDHETAMIKYSRVSKRKETEKMRFEANADLYIARKKFHEIALQYYSTLNALQYKRKLIMLNPFIALMHSQLSYFKMGHEILTDDVAKFLTQLTVESNKVQSTLNGEMKRLGGMKEKLEKEYASKYNPDPDPSDPFATFEPPNLNLKKKSGHLFMKGKQSKWERFYFFTTDGALMLERRQQDPEMVLKLDGAVASLVDTDDRRYVFQAVSKTQTKPVFFQAENQKTCEEWIATIHNIAKDRQDVTISAQMLGSQGQPDVSRAVGAVREERLKVRNWIDEQMKQASFETDSPKATSTASESERVNPFRAESIQATSQSGVQFSQAFTVRFLGSTEVQKSKGIAVVYDTMRRVLHARAVHGVFKMVESKMVISTTGVKLIDPSTHDVRTNFRLKDISFCAAHIENPRLLGFITKSSAGAKHACHVFETDKVAKEICESISCAMQIAFEDFIQNRQMASAPRAQTYPAPPQPLPENPQPKQSRNKKGDSKKTKSRKGKAAARSDLERQPETRHGQIDASAARNSWSGSDTPPVQPSQSRMIMNPHAMAQPSSPQQPFIQMSPPTSSSSSSTGAAEPEFGLFNPFFRDPATPAGTGTAATKTPIEFDPLVPNSTPVDQSVLDSEHGFNVDLLAALNQASFGSPQFPSPGSQSSPDASAAAVASNTDDALAQLLKFDDSPSAEMDPQYGGVELPRSSLNSDLDSAVDVAMQLARVSVDVGDARPSEGTDSDSDSSLSELSD